MMILTATAMPNLKGGYIPKDKPRINSYKLTNEGYALLYLADRIKGVKEGGGSSGGSSGESRQQQREQQQEQEEEGSPRRGRANK